MRAVPAWWSWRAASPREGEDPGSQGSGSGENFFFFFGHAAWPSSQTRDRNQGPGSESAKFQPQDCQGIPWRKHLKEIVHDLMHLIVWKIILRGSLTIYLESLESMIST